MSKAKSTKAPKTNKAICEEYIRKFPDTPNLSLARRIYKDYPESFTTLDAVRTTIRSVRGTCGKKLARWAVSDLKKKGVAHNPLALPPSEAFDWTPYHLTGVKRIGILSDIHIPYHDINALTVALYYLRKQDLDCILINGDLVDFYMLSRFDKDPRARTVEDELTAVKEFLAVLRRLFPTQRIIFKLGNHDERLELYMCAKAPELLGIEALTIESLLDLKTYGVEVVKSKRPIYAGGLTIFHGHELAGGICAPVNIARGLFLRAKCSALQGHNHQTSEHSETDARGKLITTWSAGCLCELHPAYARFNKWNHGFAILTLDGKTFDISNKRILNGTVL